MRERDDSCTSHHLLIVYLHIRKKFSVGLDPSFIFNNLLDLRYYQSQAPTHLPSPISMSTCPLHSSLRWVKWTWSAWTWRWWSRIMRALSFKYCPLRGDIRGESPDEGHSGGQKARAQVWARRWGQGRHVRGGVQPLQLNLKSCWCLARNIIHTHTCWIYCILSNTNLKLFWTMC